MVHDLRQALRRLRLQPGYATAAVLALALGIGCTTAIFSVLQAVLLRTLPLPHSERLVNLSEDQPQAPDASLSAPDVADLKEQLRSFESVSVAFGMRLVLGGIDRPERVIGSETDSDWFKVLQASAKIGRLYGPGSSGEVVLSERLWRRVFGADPAALGRTLTVDGQPMKFHGAGSVNERKQSSGTLVEHAIYEAKVEDIRKIAKAKEVRVDIVGGDRTVHRVFKPANIDKFRTFVLTYMGF